MSPNAPNDGAIDAEPQPGNAERPKTWDELGLGERLATVFQRFGLEGDARGATFGAASAGKRLQQVDELTKRKAAGGELNVTEERFLRKNRNAASELVGSVGRLVDAQKRIGALPRSAALRGLLEAPSWSDALKIARRNPGEIAAALGLESVPDALTGLAALAALGPVVGGAVLRGTAGTQGYASGLIGALSMEGVDLTDPEQLKRALRDNDLMQRMRARAGTQAAIAAGNTLMMAIVGGRAGKAEAGAKNKAARTRVNLPDNSVHLAKSTSGRSTAEQLAINIASGKKAEDKAADVLKNRYELERQLTLKTRSGKKTRIDFVTRDRKTGEILCVECKASATAPLSPQQRTAFPEIEKSGATVLGKGKPLFPGGTDFGPMPVKIIRDP